MEEGSGPNEASQQVLFETPNALYLHDHHHHQYPNFEGEIKIGAAHSQNAGQTINHIIKVRSLEDYINAPPPSAVKLVNEELINRKRESDDQPIAKKFPAAHFAASSLRIGAFNIVAVNPQDLVVGFYFATRKLVWEILDKRTKIMNKIVVLWDNILAMQADIGENRPGFLAIELHKEPMFYQETTDSRPRSHRTWKLREDFTGGQALTCRRHYLEFPAGTLKKHYENLIEYDHKRFWELSQRPFPSLESPYFGSDLLYQRRVTDNYFYSHHGNYDVLGSNNNAGSHQQHALVTSTQQPEQFGNTIIPSSLMYSTPPTSGFGSPYIFNNGILGDSNMALGIQSPDDYANILATDSMSCPSEGPQYENVNNIDHMRLTDHCDFDQRHMEKINSSSYSSTSAGVSMEVNYADYNSNYTSTKIDPLPNPWTNSTVEMNYADYNTSTQIDPLPNTCSTNSTMEALTHGWEEHYNCANNANMNDMYYRVLSDQARFETPALHFPPLQVANENLETQYLLPHTILHPHVTPDCSTRHLQDENDKLPWIPIGNLQRRRKHLGV